MAQVNGAAVVLSDRRQNQIIIKQASTDLDGAQNIDIALPVGLGPVLIAEAYVYVISIATRIALNATLGPVAYIIDAAGTAKDIVGAGPWFSPATNQLFAVIDPDSMVLWGNGESLRLAFEEVDTDVAPTADTQVFVRCLRLISGSEIPAEFRLTS